MKKKRKKKTKIFNISLKQFYMKLMICPCHYEIFTLWNIMTYPHFYNLQSHENLKEFCIFTQSFCPCYINTLPVGEGGIVVVIVWQLDLQLPMQSVTITTNVVSSNPAHARCAGYNIM